MRYYLLISLAVLASCDIQLTEDTRMVSVAGLELPDTLMVSEVQGDALPNGDGFLLYDYKIDKRLLQSLLKQKKFAQLPFRKNEVIDNGIYDFMSDSDHGYYFIESLDKGDPRDQILIILNESRMRLTILLVET